MSRTISRLLAVVLALAAALWIAPGCRTDDAAKDRRFRVGSFNNLTHAQALVARVEGRWGPDVEPVTFGAGPAAMEALLSGSVDMAYVGTSPALVGWVRGQGELVVLAAAVNGGAGLVTQQALKPEQLKGRVLATPQIGNTQDVALRYWLKTQGLVPGRDLTVVPMANADILGLFRRGGLEGAWIPEPWASRLELEGGGTMLVDEASLWPGGRFHTTLLVSTRRALRTRPAEVARVLRLHVELTREWEQAPEAFSHRVGAAFAKLTGQSVNPQVLKRAFHRLSPALEPEAELLQEVADHAAALHYLPEVDVAGIIDRSLLDETLARPAGGDGGSNH